MKNLLSTLSIACASLLLAAQPSHALTVSSSNDNGNIVNTAFVGGLQAGVDFGFFNTLGASVTFLLEQGDVDAGSVLFSSIISALPAGAVLDQVTLSLDAGTSFFVVGGATTLDGGAPSVSVFGNGVLLSLAPASSEIYLGNSLGLGATNWTIQLGSLGVGGKFTLTVTPVPEPETYALMLAGLGLVGTIVRRRRAR